MSFLDPVLGWTLHFHPFFGILILAFIITMIINLIYKYTTDQAEMKRLKDQIEDYRKKIKASRNDHKKMMKLNNEAMEVNMKYMGKSLKPTLYTFIPIIFIFAWMNANYTYAPLAANEPITVDVYLKDGFSGDVTLASDSLQYNKTVQAVNNEDGDTVAAFLISGEAGQHNFTVLHEGKDYFDKKGVGNSGAIVFGEKPKQQTYAGKGPVDHIEVDYPRIHPLGSFHLWSWYPGWLAVYITLSIFLSIYSRKLMKIY